MIDALDNVVRFLLRARLLGLVLIGVTLILFAVAVGAVVASVSRGIRGRRNQSDNEGDQ